MRLLDAHHHLWDLDRFHYPWLASGRTSGDPDLAAISRNYLVEDFLADVGELELVASVHVQAEIEPRLAVAETDWLQDVADSHTSGIPHAIVAFADLTDTHVTATLELHGRARNLRGIRQILHRHLDAPGSAPDLLNDDTWLRHFRLLRDHGLSFDAQVRPEQAADVVSLAKRHPETYLILNHTGMPGGFGAPEHEAWRLAMSALADCPNIAVKISGFAMVDTQWSAESIRPYLEHTLEVFGSDRCMFASNFPVDRPAKSYAELWEAFSSLVSDFSDTEREQLFVTNAAHYYRIDVRDEAFERSEVDETRSQVGETFP